MRNCSVFLLIFLSISVHARNADLGCDCEPDLPGSPGSFDDVAQIAGAITSQEFVQLSRALCTTAELNYGHEDAGDKVEDVILNHLNISRSTQNYKNRVFDFWNANAENFVCDIPSEFKPSARTPQQFMKRVIDLKMENQIFYEFLLFDSEEYPNVNVNAVEVHNGRRETVLDFIDNIINDSSKHNQYDIQQLQYLRDYLVNDFGALPANQL